MSTDNNRSAADISAAGSVGEIIALNRIANSLEDIIVLLGKIALAQTNMALKTDVNKESAEVKRLLDKRDQRKWPISTNHPDFN